MRTQAQSGSDQSQLWQGCCWHPFIKDLCRYSSLSCCDLPCAFHDLCFDTSLTRELKQPGGRPPSLCKHLLSLYRNSTSQNRLRINSSRHNIWFPWLVFSRPCPSQLRGHLSEYTCSSPFFHI